jgi:hypothetical protein
MLLYAQPSSRIVRLTVDDVIREGDQVFVRLGEATLTSARSTRRHPAPTRGQPSEHEQRYQPQQ